MWGQSISTWKELLLYLVLLNWGLVGCKPTPSRGGPLQLYLPSIQFTFWNLEAAETNYVAYVLGGRPPSAYTNRNWTLMEGITLSTNSSDIMASSCCVEQYMKHLPTIVERCTRNPSHQQLIIGNVTAFHHVFKQALTKSRGVPCPKRRFPSPPANQYERKVMGLQMLFSTRAWLRHITSSGNSTDV